MKTINIIMLSLFLAAGVATYTASPGGVTVAWTTRIENFVKHTVQSGDTLEKLAKLYGTTITKIVTRNRIGQDGKLVEGQKLVIPVDGYKEKLII